MSNKINIWGRDFDINVIYDVYEGQGVLDSQKTALDLFLKKSNKLLKDPNAVKTYCILDSKDPTLVSIDNIFKYVMPKYLYIERNQTKHIVALMCDYRFDIEHGLAIIFENEVFKEIGSQDIVL